MRTSLFSPRSEVDEAEKIGFNSRMSLAMSSMFQDHEIPTHRLHVSKFTVPSSSCFVLLSNLRILVECHAKWSHLLHWMCSLENSRKDGHLHCAAEDRAAEKPSLGSGGSLPELFSKESCHADWITIHACHGMRSSRV